MRTEPEKVRKKGAEKVRKRCGKGAEEVRKRCGKGAEKVRKRCGKGAEKVRKTQYIFRTFCNL